MPENLNDYLGKRSNEFKDEKQKQLDRLAKKREDDEAKNKKFVSTVTKIIKPKMADMLKTFSENNHSLQIGMEDLNSTTPIIQYSLSMEEPGQNTYLIEFNSNISKAEVAFRIFNHNAPSKDYCKDFTYELTGDDVEQHIIKGLKHLKT
jgi:hypothetical protein